MKKFKERALAFITASAILATVVVNNVFAYNTSKLRTPFSYGDNYVGYVSTSTRRNRLKISDKISKKL